MLSDLSRRTALVFVGCLLLYGGIAARVEAHCASGYLRQENSPNREYREDFETFGQEVAQNYAYFDRGTTDWNKVRSAYRPRLDKVQSRYDFVVLLEDMLDELCDAHTQLNTNTAHSYRLVPSSSLIWAEWRQETDKVGTALITEVRPGSRAASLGLQAGDRIERINDLPVLEAIRRRTARETRPDNPAARQWALLSLLAGRHDEAVRLTVICAADNQTATVTLAEPDAKNSPASPELPPLEDRMLPDAIGYVRLHNSLGDNNTVGAFDAALERLRNTKGLILDLRDTPGGGNTVVARGILGRFITREMPYQKHVDIGEERATGIHRAWLELVAPRGPFTYTKPVVVLVDHWTGSMGEGIAVALDGMKRATVVGTRMAGLVGAKRDAVVLPHTNIAVSFPVEKLYHVNGTPREAFVPPVLVDLSQRNSGDAGDRLLNEAIATLKKRTR